MRYVARLGPVMIRGAQFNELHLIPVQQREVAHPGFTLFLFMAQSDNPALFRHQAPLRFTWHGAFCHSVTTLAASKNFYDLHIKNVMVRVIQFPSAEIVFAGIHSPFLSRSLETTLS